MLALAGQLHHWQAEIFHGSVHPDTSCSGEGDIPMLYSRAFVRTVLGAAIMGGFVLASVPSATAALYPPQQAMSPQAVQQFLSNPGALLTQFPNGGPQMIAAVRDLAASDPQTLDALIGLLKTATPDQASAIGTALGQVALMAVGPEQAYAVQIQTVVAASGNTSALVAFSAVVGGDIKLAATGAGGGGAETPTGPGTGGGGSGGGTSVNLSSFPNSPDVFTPTSLGGGSPGSPGNTPVSPSIP
jgi:hypothetical protein